MQHVVTRVDICYTTGVEAVKVESRFLLCNLLYSVRVSVEYDESTISIKLGRSPIEQEHIA
jgi:hypothetical protein